jgi:hypothetical protein
LIHIDHQTTNIALPDFQLAPDSISKFEFRHSHHHSQKSAKRNMLRQLKIELLQKLFQSAGRSLPFHYVQYSQHQRKESALTSHQYYYLHKSVKEKLEGLICCEQII